MFFLEFGAPHVEVINPHPFDKKMTEDRIFLRRRRKVYLHGEWSLMILDCNWSLESLGYFSNQDVDLHEMERPFLATTGQFLKCVTYDEGRKSCVFDFDLGAQLTTSPKERSDPLEEQWDLKNPEGIYISLLNNGEITRKPDGDI